MSHPNELQPGQSTDELKIGAADFLCEIALLADGLEKLLIEVTSGQDLDLLTVARSTCLHIGWLADRAATAYGGPSRSLRGGVAEDWFLSPATAQAVSHAAQGALPRGEA